MTGPDHDSQDWWDTPSDGRPEVRIWLDRTDTGTSILVSTDDDGRQAFDAFWQPNQPEDNE